MKQFSNALEIINSTSKRNEKKKALHNYLSTLDTPSLIAASQILLNETITNVGIHTIEGINETQTTLFTTTTSIIDFNDILKQFTHSSTTNLKIINDLISTSTPVEKKYIKKALLNNINVGMSTNTVLDVLATILNDHDLRSHYFICSDIATHIKMEYNGPKLFTPIMPMLAKVQHIDEPHLIQAKADGYRASYHKLDDVWAIYSRRCEDISSKHHELGELITQTLQHINSVILDGELITSTMTFQESLRNDAELIPKFFDILHLNGDSLIDMPLHERLFKLKSLNLPPDWHVTSYHNYSIEDAFNHAISNNYEGLIIKNLNEPYIPHQRKWGKIKHGVDTADLIITSLERGQGKRENKIGSVMCSIMYNDTLMPICKVGSGFTDEVINKLMLMHDVSADDFTANETITIENPHVVIEVSYFELTVSPTYQIGHSLRFPIFEKIRYDKSINDITNFNDLPK